MRELLVSYILLSGTARKKLRKQNMQEWRNWQTRRLQVPVVARSCGFKSHLLHLFLSADRKPPAGYIASSSQHSCSLSVPRQISARAGTAAACRVYRTKKDRGKVVSDLSSVFSIFSVFLFFFPPVHGPFIGCVIRTFYFFLLPGSSEPTAISRVPIKMKKSEKLNTRFLISSFLQLMLK